MKWKDCPDRADKWAWHAQLYAFRRVYLSAPLDEQTSPADPTGEWFNETLVRAAAERIQAKQRQQHPFSFTDDEHTERHQYAQLNGYPDWQHFLDAVNAGDQHIRHFITWANAKRETTTSPNSGSFTKAGDALRHKVA